MISSTTTTLRPINIAFLVDFNDKKALEEVIYINSYLWGGAYNAVIPFYKRIPSSYKKDFFRKNALEIINGYIHNYDPDFIVNLSSFDIKKLKNRDRGKDWTIVTKEEILGKYSSTAIPNIGIGLDEILNHLEEKEFKYVRKNPVPIYDIQIPRRYNQFYSSIFGAIEPSVWQKITKRFNKSLGIKPLSIDKDNYLDALKSENWFIRRLTDYYLKRFSGDSFTSGYVMYMDANNWHDIVDYINLRATGASVLPIAKQGVSSDNLEYIKSYIKANTKRNKHNKDIEYTPNILKARSITEDEFTAFVDKISKSYPAKGRPQLTVQQWYPRLWDKEDRNRSYSKQSVVEVTNSRQSFSTDEAEVKLVKPRFGASNFDVKYQFANDIKFDVYGADNYYAEVLGETEQLASHILGSHSYDHWRISQRGATYIASGWERDEKTVRLKIPEAQKFFASWYKNETNIGIELSTPGKVAKQMLKKLGGPDRVRILSNEGILRLIQSTVGNGSAAPTLTSKKLMSELNKIASKSKMWDAKGLLGWLLHIGALELGAEIQCPHCDKHNWYPLNRLDNTLVCEKCLDEYDVPKDNPQQGLVWAYSLVGPFRLPKMADGAYTTLLALYFLNETMHFSITPHLSFQKPKDTDIEADFGLLIHDRSYYGSKVSSALGECKSFKGEFEARDVNRMKNMAKGLDDPILIFATLKNKLDKGEKRRLNQLLVSQRKARLKNGNKSRLLILTGNELFSDFLGLEKQWEGLTKKHKSLAKHIGGADMASLCDATQQLYLSSQSYSDWFQEVFHPKKETASVKEVYCGKACFVMKKNIDRTYPNQQEEEFLNIAVNKFFDISEELMSERTINPELRFVLLVKMMSIYTEALNYLPIKKYLEHIERKRPPGELTAYKYLEIIRHILLHFSFYSTWDEVCFSKSLITWTGKHSRIDKFLTEYDNHESYKWRIWDAKNKEMTYGYQFNFPKGYSEGKTIYLKDLIDEDKGIKFSVHLIRQMFYSQIVSITEIDD